MKQEKVISPPHYGGGDPKDKRFQYDVEPEDGVEKEKKQPSMAASMGASASDRSGVISGYSSKRDRLSSDGKGHLRHYAISHPLDAAKV